MLSFHKMTPLVLKLHSFCYFDPLDVGALSTCSRWRCETIARKCAVSSSNVELWWATKSYTNIKQTIAASTIYYALMHNGETLYNCLSLTTFLGGCHWPHFPYMQLCINVVHWNSQGHISVKYQYLDLNPERSVTYCLQWECLLRIEKRHILAFSF